MRTDETDKYWQFIGADDPYWGVLTDPRFAKGNLTREDLDEFYASGERHIDCVFNTIHKYIDAGFVADSAMDFGCGVGRLVVPLAARCRKVFGIDISADMLQRAKERCDVEGLSNVQLVMGDDQISNVTDTFDLIHSFIVFQHMDADRGSAIVDHILHLLREGGVGVLHFVYFKEVYSKYPRLREFAERLGIYNTLVSMRELLPQKVKPSHGKSPDGMEMQLHPYDLNLILRKLQTAGVRRLHLEYTEHGCFGVVLFFKKSSGDVYKL
ncbi:MAG TPA: class I SAM-dependent methyltransferase [Halioglobus sp.]